ncbi:GPW/gp25 family protein [Streptomyces sp. NPDC045456]|uniref:GPW/gp25 family protein n=1 Tax=Streptomyces sp. NPDC045456 TaxID=3155254 RepID=UPI00340D1561
MSEQLAIPFALDASGRIATVTDPDRQTSQRVRAVVATAPSERVMQPEFGTDLRPFLFAPNDPITREALRHTVKDAVARWEPGAVVTTVEPVIEDEAEGIADVLVDIGRGNAHPEAAASHVQEVVVRPGGRVDAY